MIRSANPDCGRRPRPSATKRFRQSRHVCRFTPSSSAMVKSLDPWCASNTMRQRVTTCWGVPCARTHVSSSSCCSGFSFKAIGLLLMRPLNHLEIDLSSYFSANTLAHLPFDPVHDRELGLQQLRSLLNTCALRQL